MMNPNKLRRLAAATLLLAFTLPQAATAAAPATETDEAVYINLDYYGVPETTRIVKGVNLTATLRLPTTATIPRSTICPPTTSPRSRTGRCPGRSRATG